MVKLEREDRNKLLKLLESLPIFQTYRGRRMLLESSGLDILISQLDLEGPPFIVAGEIIHSLESYGKITFDNEALGMFLNSIKNYLGIGDESQKFIDEILYHYNLMAPVKTINTVDEWKGHTSSNDLLEKIIGENTLKHIAFLKRAIEVSNSVALIDVGKWVGTGFMISPNLLITNNHVLPDFSHLSNTIFKFNFQLTFEGREEEVSIYHSKPSGLFYTNIDLDYSIVELTENPGKDWGMVNLSSEIVKEGERIYIIQHPGGLPKQISFQNNFVEYAEHNVIQYLTSTMAGSSGSPVFNEKWLVVALHHAGGMIIEPKTGQRNFRNEGISMKAILNDLPNELKSEIIKYYD